MPRPILHTATRATMTLEIVMGTLKTIATAMDRKIQH